MSYKALCLIDPLLAYGVGSVVGVWALTKEPDVRKKLSDRRLSVFFPHGLTARDFASENFLKNAQHAELVFDALE